MPQADHSVRILIADDHAPVRRSLRDLLQDDGMRVVGEAANGHEAVRLCEQLCPDIAVLDISMPLLNGFAAAQQISQLCPNTKVIFLTGHTLKEYLSEALRAGCLGYVFKDHAGIDLLEAIKSVLDGRTYISGTLAT